MDEATRTDKSDTLPDLPAGWESGRVADVARIYSGGTPSKKNQAYWTGAIPWASPKDLKRPYLHDTEDHISEEGLADGSRLVPAGSLFVVIRGMILGRDVPVSMATVPMAFNQDMKAIVPNRRIDGTFLLYAFGHFKRALFPEIGTSAHGTRRIGTSAIEEFKVPLPPLEEQRAISFILRTVQRAKEATEKAIAAACQLKHSLMRHLFSYGPVPVEQADQIQLKETDFGSVPQGWNAARLSECAVVQTGVAKGRKLNGTDTVKVPYLRVANVQDGYLDLSEMKTIEIRRSELSRYSLQPGDVVLTEGGDFDKLGRGFIWNDEVPGCVHQNHIFAVRADRRLLIPEFLAYQTQSTYGKAYFLSVAHKTTNLACINTTKLKGFPVLLPPKNEQHEIVEALRAVDRKIAREESRQRSLEAMFGSLLHHLMTGRLRVAQLDLPIAAEEPP
jgi:type I restriction enzyme S subunit